MPKTETAKRMTSTSRIAQLPLSFGDIELAWPVEVNADDIDDIEQWIELMMTMIRRDAQSHEKEINSAGDDEFQVQDGGSQ